jgi:hypothetical protein
MTSLSLQCCDDISKKSYSMQELGEIFIDGLPEHIAMLKIRSLDCRRCSQVTRARTY